MAGRRLRMLALAGLLGAGCAHGPPAAEGSTPAEELAGRAARLRDYPASLPICPAWLPAMLVDDALAAKAGPDDLMSVRGRLTPIDMPCGARQCPARACCNRCEFRFGLISPSGRLLRLDRWREAPAFELDCDPRAAAWMPTLVVVVSGFLVEDSGADAGPTLAVDKTCRIE